MLFAHLLFFILQAASLSPVGLWQTIDDNTHKPRGLVRLYEQDGAIFGRVEATLDPKEAGLSCIKCRDERKDRPVVGLTIVRNMRKHGNEYAGGDILDPETGSVYKCKMTVEDGGKRLAVRGFIGISLIGRSQTWFRKE